MKKMPTIDSLRKIAVVMHNAVKPITGVLIMRQTMLSYSACNQILNYLDTKGILTSVKTKRERYYETGKKFEKFYDWIKQSEELFGK